MPARAGSRVSAQAGRAAFALGISLLQPPLKPPLLSYCSFCCHGDALISKFGAVFRRCFDPSQIFLGPMEREVGPVLQELDLGSLPSPVAGSL